MQKKLTLRIEESKILKAKELARKQGTSVSKMVSDYFEFLELKKVENKQDDATPITDSLSGLFSGEVDEEDYKKYLERKHSE